MPKKEPTTKEIQETLLQSVNSARLCFRDAIAAKTWLERIDALDSLEHDLNCLVKNLPTLQADCYTEDGEIKEGLIS